MTYLVRGLEVAVLENSTRISKRLMLDIGEWAQKCENLGIAHKRPTEIINCGIGPSNEVDRSSSGVNQLLSSSKGLPNVIKTGLAQVTDIGAMHVP